MSKSYLTEAFKSLAMLNEEDFELNDDGVEEMQSVLSIHDDPIEIIDTEAETEDDLEETHIGDAILDCVVCHSKLYKNPKEIIIDDAGEGSVVNYGEECPYCYSTDGFKLIGQIAPFEFEKETEVKVDDEVVDSDDEVADDEEKEVEVDVEEKEEVDESLKKKKLKEYLDKSELELLVPESEVKDKVVELTDELFAHFQKKLGITSGDIDPLDSVALEDLQNSFTNLVMEVLAYETPDEYSIEHATLVNNESLKECKTLGSAASKRKGKTAKTEDIKHTETLVDDEGTEVVVDGKTPQEAEQKAKQLNQKLGNKMKTVAKNKVVDGQIQEEFEKVDIDTGDQVIHISSEDKEEQEPETDKEMIVPPTPELEAEVDNNTEEAEEDKEENSTVDVDFDEFDEETFDTFGESYLKKVYNNVESYKTSEISTRGNNLVVEGVIKFKSGKEKKTSFVFEAKDMTKSGRARFVGKNESICSSKKAFTLTGKFDNGKFLAESFNYNYRAKDTDGKTSRLYGTFKK